MTPDQNNEQQEKPQVDTAPAPEAQAEPAANAPVQDNAYQQPQQQQQQPQQPQQPQPAPKPPVFSPWYNLDGTPREKNPNAPWWANPYTWRSDEEKAQEMAAFQKAQQEYEQYMQNQGAQQGVQQGAPGNFGQGQAWQQNAAQPGAPQGQTAQQPIAPASAEPQQSAVPTPTQPQQPAQPEAPVAPAAPTAAAAPATPAAPVASEGNAAQQPAQSEEPTTPATPTAPAAPVAPEGQPAPAQPQAQIPPAGTQAPVPQDPAQQPNVAPGQPGYQGQPQQPGQPAPGQQPNPNQQAQGPFGQTPWGTTPNGKWDPNDPNVKNFFGNNLDPNRSLTLGARVPWFILGFIGGIFGILAVWFMTGFWPEKLRKQAFWATWIGFAVQAVVVITLMNTGVLGSGTVGGTFSFGGGSSSGNTSAFG